MSIHSYYTGFIHRVMPISIYLSLFYVILVGFNVSCFTVIAVWHKQTGTTSFNLDNMKRKHNTL